MVGLRLTSFYRRADAYAYLFNIISTPRGSLNKPGALEDKVAKVAKAMSVGTFNFNELS